MLGWVSQGYKAFKATREEYRDGFVKATRLSRLQGYLGYKAIKATGGWHRARILKAIKATGGVCRDGF